MKLVIIHMNQMHCKKECMKYMILLWNHKLQPTEAPRDHVCIAYRAIWVLSQLLLLSRQNWQVSMGQWCSLRLMWLGVAALALKHIDYEYKAVHLVRNGGEQHSTAYRAMNPLREVPSLQVDGHVLTQSVRTPKLLALYLTHLSHIT